MPSLAIVDAGPHVAWFDASDNQHTQVVDLLESLEYEFVIAAMALAEAAYLVGRRYGPLIEARLVEIVSSFDIIAPTGTDLARMAQLMRQYADFPLGAADASVIALAERFDTPYVVTIDHRHFRAVRPAHVESLHLLPSI